MIDIGLKNTFKDQWSLHENEATLIWKFTLTLSLAREVT